MLQIFRDTHIDFLSKRGIAVRVSMIAIGITIVSLIVHGGPRFGIDFSGGTLLQLRFDQAMEVSDLRATLDGIGMGNAEIKTVGSNQEVMIKVQQSETGATTPERIREAITAAYPGIAYEVRRQETVGPRIGNELVTSAVWAVLIALLLMVVYISIRFEFRFALGALAALAHDVLITLGVFSLLNLEISLVIVAALLTIVGYSLNDTIVVFDRVRENMKLLRKESLINVLNKSINQTLSRTIITSGTTLLVVLTLNIFGGEVISGFAIALLTGIIVGTYSSMFIASPLLVWWEERDAAKRAALARR